MEKLEQYLKEQPQAVANAEGKLLSDVAYERLRDAFRNADVTAGEPLSEVKLSKVLGISRTPVRAALQQLAQEGLLDNIPGRAFTIASRNVKDVIDVVHIRMLLEPEMVRLATDSMSNEQLERLEETMTEMEVAAEQGNRQSWSIHDALYHEIIQDSCPNELLGKTVVQLRNRVHYSANIDTETDQNRLVHCTEEHREVVEAISRRDSQGAAEAMKQHLTALQESLFNRLRY